MSNHTATRTATARTNHYVVEVDGQTVAEFDAVHEYAYVVLSTGCQYSGVKMKTNSLAAAQKKVARQMAANGHHAGFTSRVVEVTAK